MEIHFANTHIHRERVAVPMHSHPVLEIVVYIEGEGSSQIGKTRFAVSPGAITITPSGERHDQLETTCMSSLCFGVVESGLEDLQGCIFDHGGGVRFLAERLMAELAEQAPFYELVADGLLRQMAGLIRRLAATPEKKPRQEELVNQALGMIRQAEGKMTVSKLSDTLYVSRDYLRHLFQEYASKSPMKHILEARLEKAKQLLSKTNTPVAEAASQAGFDNPYYFSRLFKQVTGSTPTAFRRQKRSGPHARK
ncbi:MAG: AraC family transcriptional regulator [Verrucomicrobiota bacterium]